MYSLRQLAMRGGAYLSLRQGFGVFVSFGGIILLTRIIGPEGYGLYAAAFGIFTFLFTVCLWGVEIYLVRREGEEREEAYHQAFTLLLMLGVAGTPAVYRGAPAPAGLGASRRLRAGGPDDVSQFAARPANQGAVCTPRTGFGLQMGGDSGTLRLDDLLRCSFDLCVSWERRDGPGLWLVDTAGTTSDHSLSGVPLPSQAVLEHRARKADDQLWSELLGFLLDLAAS